MKNVKLTPEQISIILGLLINRATYLKSKNPQSQTVALLQRAISELAGALNEAEKGTGSLDPK